MAVTATPIFTQSPLIGIATLTSPTAVLSRSNITGTTGLTQLTPVSTNGKRLDWIRVISKGTSTPGIVFIWLYNGTTAFLIDEIQIQSAVTSSSVQPASKIDTFYQTAGFNLQPTYQLYVSVTTTQDLNVMAFGGDY